MGSTGKPWPNGHRRQMPEKNSSKDKKVNQAKKKNSGETAWALGAAGALGVARYRRRAR